MLRNLLLRPISVTMLVFALLILGCVSMRMIPVSLVPDMDVPHLSVQVSSPGKSADQVEKDILSLLRSSLVQMSGLVDFRSIAYDGMGSIDLEFEPGSQMDLLFVETNERVDRVWPLLSGVSERPRVVKANTNDIPAFYLDVTLRKPIGTDTDSDMVDYGAIEKVSSDFLGLSSFVRQVVVRQLEQLEEVSMVDVSGAANGQYTIVPDLDKLHRIGWTIEDLESALMEADLDLGGIHVQDGGYLYHVKFETSINGLNDLEEICFNVDGRLFRLKELARISMEPRPRQGLVISDGQEAISLAVIKQPSVRMSELKQAVEKHLKALQDDYPQLRIEIRRDQTELLDFSLENLVSNIVFGILFACVVIMVMMRDLKSALLVILTIPLTLLISLVVFYLLGISINIVSLSGLVLGVGMMVDNSIVVVDNISVRWKLDGCLSDAVVHGTEEVRMPMLSSVLTTCAVFLPLIFLHGTAGAIFYEQAMAVAITLLVAYALAVILLPIYFHWWFSGCSGTGKLNILPSAYFGKMQQSYEKALKWIFRHRFFMWLTYGISAMGIVFLFRFLDKQRFPPVSYSDMLVNIQWNQPISLSSNVTRSSSILGVLGEGVTETTLYVGIQDFLLSHGCDGGMSGSVLYVRCREEKDIAEVKQRVKAYLMSSYPLADYQFSASGNVFDQIFGDNSAPLTASIRPKVGDFFNVDEFKKLCENISDSLGVYGLPLAVSPLMLQNQITYEANVERMALYGVSYEDLRGVLKSVAGGNILLRITDGVEHVPVVFGSSDNGWERRLMETIIPSANGEIPLKVLLERKQTQCLPVLMADRTGVCFPIDFDVKGKDVQKVVDMVEGCVDRTDSFMVSFKGSYFTSRELVKQLISLLIIAILVLYLILSAQFESLVQPCIILSELVVDIFVSLLVLWLLGESINIMSMTGLIVVCGIVVNDSILKIDTINGLRKNGYSLKRAVMEAGRRRLNPICMTSLTTILSVAPFLTRGDMGSDLQFPLSVVVIGGMIAGTIVSILFVPVVYYSIYKGRS